MGTLSGHTATPSRSWQDWSEQFLPKAALLDLGEHDYHGMSWLDELAGQAGTIIVVFPKINQCSLLQELLWPVLQCRNLLMPSKGSR